MEVSFNLTYLFLRRNGAGVLALNLTFLLTASHFRTLLFIGLAASGFASVAHMAIVERLAGLQDFPIQAFALMAVFYLSGAIFYVARVPERFSSGTFDIWVSDIRANRDVARASRIKGGNTDRHPVRWT